MANRKIITALRPVNSDEMCNNMATLKSKQMRNTLTCMANAECQVKKKQPRREKKHFYDMEMKSYLEMVMAE